MSQFPNRAALWLNKLAPNAPLMSGLCPSVQVADGQINGENVRFIAVVPDANNHYPRAAGGARVVVVSIRDHGDKTHVFAINLAVCHLDGRAQAAHQRRVGRQFVQPQRGAVWELTHYLSSRAKSCLICAVSACWRVSNWLKRRR